MLVVELCTGKEVGVKCGVQTYVWAILCRFLPKGWAAQGQGDTSQDLGEWLLLRAEILEVTQGWEP